MSQETPSAGNTPLLERVQNILLRPKLEWPVIEAEAATVRSVFVPYAVLLTAIAPLATLIGQQLMPVRVFGSVYRVNLFGGMISALVTWGLSLLAVYLLALIIEALAPSFDGVKDRLRAVKVAVYASTAAWVAGIFGLIPALSWLGGLLGLYSLYLLYLGLGRLMRVPETKTIGYTVVVVLAAIVLWVIVGAIVGSIIGAGVLSAAVFSY